MVEMAIARQRNFVGILPTGGGKSLVFLLPSLVEERFMTVVLIPNKMLLRDMIRKARAARIECAQWTTNTLGSPKVKVLFVALETATHVKFRA
jgi:superfamily II DNA helicase RecQ